MERVVGVLSGLFYYCRRWSDLAKFAVMTLAVVSIIAKRNSHCYKFLVNLFGILCGA